MANWYETRSSNKACRIDLDQVVAVVAKKKGHVEVFLRGAHSITVKGTVDEFAPVTEIDHAD